MSLWAAEEVVDSFVSSIFLDEHRSTKTSIEPKSMKWLSVTPVGSVGTTNRVSASRGLECSNTNIVIVESPCSAHIHSVAECLLFLPDGEVNFCSFSRSTFLGRHKIDTDAIGLVLAIDEDKHGQTLVDEAFGCQVDCEWLRSVGHNNVGLHNAVPIAGLVLLERCASVRPLYGAGQAPQLGHPGGFVSSFWMRRSQVCRDEEAKENDRSRCKIESLHSNEAATSSTRLGFWDWKPCAPCIVLLASSVVTVSLLALS